MSDFEEEIMCSQISNGDYTNTQSSDFGGDIVDGLGDDTGRNIVSLERNSSVIHNVNSSEIVTRSGLRILYDNVHFEDISSDEELDNM